MHHQLLLIEAPGSSEDRLAVVGIVIILIGAAALVFAIPFGMAWLVDSVGTWIGWAILVAALAILAVAYVVWIWPLMAVAAWTAACAFYWAAMLGGN
ncbi:hypothetical protein ACWF9G_22630 [Nocardia sp. NPDC055029]